MDIDRLFRAIGDLHLVYRAVVTTINGKVSRCCTVTAYGQAPWSLIAFCYEFLRNQRTLDSSLPFLFPLPYRAVLILHF